MQRASRYALLAAAGAALAALGVLLSIYASYYASPRLSNSTEVDARVEGELSLALSLPGATGERVYYRVELRSGSGFSALLAFRAEGGVLGVVDLGSSTSISREGMVLLERAPTDAVLTIRCGACEVKGFLKVRYSSVDYGRLLALNVAAAASSFTGLTLAAYGALTSAILRRAGGARGGAGGRPREDR